LRFDSDDPDLNPGYETGGNMPYSSNKELPDSVRHVLPAQAQTIYQEAFNSAWDQYKDPDDRRGEESREEVAHKVAWAAVKHEYSKGDDDKWHPKN
jgi:cation transport regulator